MMVWRSCKDGIPKAGLYEVLMLVCNGNGNKMWFQTQAIYNTNNNLWTVLIDARENYWSCDAGVPSYYLKIPEYPPIPYEGPICEYFNNNYCMAQKDAPRCYCQGDKNKCEK